MDSPAALVLLIEAFEYLRTEWDGEAEEFALVYSLFTQCRSQGIEFGPAFIFAMEELHRECRHGETDGDSDGADNDDRDGSDELLLDDGFYALVPEPLRKAS